MVVIAGMPWRGNHRPTPGARHQRQWGKRSHYRWPPSPPRQDDAHRTLPHRPETVTKSAVHRPSMIGGDGRQMLDTMVRARQPLKHGSLTVDRLESDQWYPAREQITPSFQNSPQMTVRMLVREMHHCHSK